MENILQDIRYGVRSLIKTPGFTAVAVILLALGIGANTAIFTVVNAVLLRPLPYPDSDHLVMLWETNPRFQIGVDTLPVTHGNFMDWREQNSVFEHVSALGAGRWNLTGAGEPDRISGASVSSNFFRLMGLEPKLGRAFRDDEERPGAGKVVVISHSLWQGRFGGEPGVIGKTMTLDGESYTVIGVAPEGFQFPRANELPYFVGVATKTDLWRPMILGDDFVNKTRANHQLSVMAKLKPGVTRERAQSEMTAIAERLEQSYPDSNQGIGVKVVPLNEQVVGNVRPALWVLMGAVALVLLIACANAANLLLARSSARQKEIAIRTALGASRGRIVRQLLTEALLLSMTSAVVGTLLSLWGIKAMLSLSRETLPRAYEISVDGRVLGFTVVIALLTSVIFGLTPALQASKINLTDSLKEGSRGLSGGQRLNHVRSVLVISEVALSLVLLIGAGLMIKSLASLLKVDPGFKPDNTLTMQIALLGSKYPSANQQIAFFQDVTHRVETLPGVQSVGLISSAPLSGGVYAGGFSIEGRVATSEADDFVADRRMISPEYFNALGIPLLKGRGFTDRDDQTSTGVVVVSESWARRYLPSEDPIGKRIKLGGRNSTRPWLSIVGIAGDVRDTALESDARPCVYIPYPQFPSSAMTLVVRAAFDPKLLISGIRDEVWAVDQDQPVTDVKTMDQYVAASVLPRRFNAMLLAVFASLALVLASVGIYGVMAYSVTQRTHEIGIRVALGAQSSHVIRLIVGRGMALVLTGIAIGIAGALALTRVMTSLLYGVSATDPLTFAGLSVMLAAVALLASYIPARRATKVDPMIALRCE
ncbi:MAG TPA: ABC transporter permease [Blastocatellia bacterium]|nr:ABC transporter permease [Blastocatellia bacterium]